MEPSNRRTYYVQKPPDIHRPVSSVFTSSTSLFGNCFSTKTNTLTSIGSNYAEDLTGSQEMEFMAFCDSLRSLKESFALTNEHSDDQVMDQVKEMNSLLGQSLKKCPSLYSKDLLQMATLVNTKIKGFFNCSDSAAKVKLSDVILCAIDRLNVAFEKSLSEISSSFGVLPRAESFENLSMEPNVSIDSYSVDAGDAGDEVDDILLNVTSGIDRALQHALSWVDSAKFMMAYIDKRTNLELDLAKHLIRLATTSQQNMRGEKMPLQLAYHAAFTLDVEFADGINRFCSIVQTEKFLQPLTVRCAEHRKVCKDLKDIWSKEERQMREATESLRKSKAAYNARYRESMKTKDATQRAIADSNILNDASALIRLEKRRKMEEEAVAKVITATEQYQRCIGIANDTKAQMNVTKKKILVDIRQLVDESDRILKMATIDYFTLMATRTAAIPLQFQALRKSSERYEPGSVYAQYAEMLSASSNVSLQDEEPFTFQPYSPSLEEITEFRKRLSPPQEVFSSEFSQDMDTKRLLVEEDSISRNYSGSRSLDSSPVRSRRYVVQSHRKLTNSSSFDGLTDLNDDDDKDSLKSDCRDFVDVRVIRGVLMSKVAQMHEFKKLRTFARCRQCDCYIYFNGFECTLCGLSSHKQCLRNLRWECGHRQCRLDRPLVIGQKSLPDRVPYVVKKCIEQIDATGLEVKGIFRVSAVKSRVETLCQKLESEDDMIDLSTESPHTIAGLIRLYLRQLEDPLIPFQVCDELVNLVKNSGQTENNSELIRQMKSVLSCLPGENFWTLSCLVHHLKRVAHFSDVNLMSASNLAVVFGPTLMRSSKDPVTANSIVDNGHQCGAVELLIVHAEDIFGSDPIPSNCPTSEDLPDAPAAQQTVTDKSSDVVNSSVSPENKDYCRSTTIWFDQNLYNEPKSPENVAENRQRPSRVRDQLPRRSDGDGSSLSPIDVAPPHHSSLDSFSRLPRDGGDLGEEGRVAQLSSSFQRTRAYSPQSHRRFNTAAPVRRESFNLRKPYSVDAVVSKFSRSVKNSNNSNNNNDDD